jgi:hypothetical protein
MQTSTCKCRAVEQRSLQPLLQFMLLALLAWVCAWYGACACRRRPIRPVLRSDGGSGQSLGLLAAHAWLRDGATGRESPLVMGLVDLGSTFSLCNWKV